MNDKLKETLDTQIKVYLEILARAKIELIASKRIENPQERILKGMNDLPSIKERVIMSRKIIEDLIKLKKIIEGKE